MTARLPADGPPRVGDMALLVSPPVAGNPAWLGRVWDRRRREPSMVVAWIGGARREVELVTRGDTAAESWRAPSDDLLVVGRAAWAMLEENLDAEVAAGALRGSTVALDFDGPIHSYRSGWTGYVPEDPPTEGALAFVTFLLTAGARVVVHTSRADHPRGVAGVRAYLKEHGFPDLRVTYTKVPAAAYVDDRAVHFDARKRLPYDDALLAEVVRMCRTRHHGEAHEDERFARDAADDEAMEQYADAVERTQLEHLAEGRLLDDVSAAALVCVHPGCEDPRDPRWHDHERKPEDFCGKGDPHGPHTWMPKPPRVGVSRDCPGTDTTGSASSQHYIETGSYLPAGEAEGEGG